MQYKNMIPKFIVISGIVVFAALTVVAVFPTAKRMFEINQKLSEGLTHLRKLESASRISGDKKTTNGIGVVATAWTNVFNDHSTIDLHNLERLVTEIQGNDLESLNFEKLNAWLDMIVSIQPTSKPYVEDLARKNLSLAFSRSRAP